MAKTSWPAAEGREIPANLNAAQKVAHGLKADPSSAI
jgi:hypothetical protein